MRINYKLVAEKYLNIFSLPKETYISSYKKKLLFDTIFMNLILEVMIVIILEVQLKSLCKKKNYKFQKAKL